MRLFVAVLLLLVGLFALTPSPSNVDAIAADPAVVSEMQYPILYIAHDGSVREDTGFLDRIRGRRGGEQGGQESERTQPYDPNTAPQFQKPPADGTVQAPASEAPADEAAAEDAAAVPAELSPEQKEQLMSAIVAFVSALIGAFAGSGGANPAFKAILEAVLSAVGSKATARVKSRVTGTRTRAKRKPVKK